MMASMKRANEIMMKELNDYHIREKEMQKKEAMLAGVIQENINMKAELDELRAKKNESELLKQQLEQSQSQSKSSQKDFELQLKQKDKELQDMLMQLNQAKALEIELKNKQEEEKVIKNALNEAKNREAELLAKLKSGAELSQSEQDELEKLRQIIKQKEAEIEDLKNQLRNLKNQYEVAQNAQNEADKVQQQIEKLKEDLKQSQLNQLQLKEDKFKLEQDNLQQKTEIQKKDKEIHSLKEKVMKQEFEIKALKEFEQQAQNQILPTSLETKLDESEMQMFRIKLGYIKKITFFLTITLFFTMMINGLSIFSTQWMSGTLLKTMNHNPNYIDNVIGSSANYADSILGIYERGLFKRCEYYNSFPNSNSTLNQTYVVQVQKRFPSCQQMNYPLTYQNSTQQSLELISGSGYNNITNYWWNNYTQLTTNNLTFFYPNNNTLWGWEPTQCLSYQTQVIPYSEFTLSNFNGCVDEINTLPSMGFVQFCALMSLILNGAMLVILFMVFLNPSKYIDSIKKITIVLVSQIIFGVLCTIIYSSVYNKLYPAGINKGIYTIPVNQVLQNMQVLAPHLFQPKYNISTTTGYHLVSYSLSWAINILIIPFLYLIHINSQ